MGELIENTSVKEKQIEYWRNRNINLDMGDSLIRLLTIPKQNGPQQQAKFNLPLSQDITDTLLSIARDADLSLYILFVTILKAAIARYTGDALISLISPICNALPEAPGGDSYESEFIILQDSILLDKGLKDNAQITRRTIIGAYSNQNFFRSGLSECALLERIVEESVLVCMDTIHIHKNLIANSPIVIRLNKEERKLSVDVVFNALKISSDLIKQFALHLLNLIEKCSQNVSHPFNLIEFMTKDELAKIDAMTTERNISRPNIQLHDLFIEQVRKTPLSTAIIYEGLKVSYRELDNRSNCIARGLVAIGIIPGDFVALLCQRGVDMIAAILAVGKAGATFIPVSPDEPEVRRSQFFKMAEPKLVITNLDPNSFTLDFPIQAISDLANSGDITCELPTNIDTSHLAYAIFTSGSTGLPKCVLVEHPGIINSVIWRREAYGFSSSHRSLLLFPYNFDAFILNLFAPLSAGSATILIRDEEARSPKELIRYLTSQNPTHMTLTPALYQAILEECTSEDLASLVSVTLAGDVARVGTITHSKSLREDLVLTNEYGPTECSVVATFHPDIAPEKTTTIGRPIDNISLYILDANYLPVPIGVYGQIALSGVGLFRGYLGKQADKNLIPWRNKKIYLTGDIGRWTSEFNVEFKARNDDYVKVRGYRIDLEEIRQVILSFSGVKDAIVFIDSADTENIIYSCITTANTLVIDDINDYLKTRLPQYMWPTQIFCLPHIPLTASGKYDLQEIKIQIESMLANITENTPNTDTERRLVEIWKQILNTPKINMNRSFFALGGHSLKAMQLLSRIKTEFDVTLFLEDIFHSNTVRLLASHIEQENHNSVGNIFKAQNSRWYTLSSAQERMLVLSNDENLGESYNIQIVLSIAGQVDKLRLKHALSAMLRRHDTLKTYFSYQGTKPMQAVDPTCDIRFKEIFAKTTDDINDVIKGSLNHFDLTYAPLWSTTILNKNESEQYIVFEFHHIIIDEIGIIIFFRELVQFYNKKVTKGLFEIDYIDYSVWQREQLITPAYHQKIDYWCSKLSSAKLGPINFIPPNLMIEPDGQPGGQYKILLSEELSTRISIFCEHHNVSRYMFFVATLATLLHLTSNEEDIIIGTPISNRIIPETQSIIGLFTNTVLLYYHIDSKQSFDDFLEVVKRELLEDIARADVQLDDLIRAIGGKRSVNNRTLFNIMLTVLDNEINTIEFDNFTATPIDYYNGTTKFDLLLEIRALGNNIGVAFEYNRCRLPDELLVNFAEYFVTLLDSIIVTPYNSLGSFPIRSAFPHTHTVEENKLHTLPVKIDNIDMNNPILWSERDIQNPSLQDQLVHAWAEILELKTTEIGLQDSFFMLGGDSIAATMLTQKIRSWGYQIRLSKVFENDTIEKLAIELNNNYEAGL